MKSVSKCSTVSRVSSCFRFVIDVSICVVKKKKKKKRIIQGLQPYSVNNTFLTDSQTRFYYLETVLS